MDIGRWYAHRSAVGGRLSRLKRRLQIIWAGADVCALFANNLGSFANKRGLTIIGTKTYAKDQSSSSGPRSGRIPPRATCSASKNA
jgi:hypothetical protein